MANTEHIETLDLLDKISVITYRSGITLFSLALLLSSLAIADDISLILINLPIKTLSLALLALSCAMSAANLHVYDKKVRMIITWSAWIGLILLTQLDDSQLLWIPLGFMFVTFSGIALKESFCFNVAGLKMVPILLCISTFMFALEVWIVAILCFSLCAVIFLFLSIQKWKMPLHFDIGNKKLYQN